MGQLAKINPLILLIVLILLVFAYPVASALGAPVPEANQEMLIGAVLIGLGTAGSAAYARRLPGPPPSPGEDEEGEPPGARPGT